MTLKPYNDKARCPKCGSTEVATRHCTGVDVWGDTCRIPPRQLARSEHVDRRCRRCAFAWAEAALETSLTLVGSGGEDRVERIAYTVKEAAAALGLSEDTLRDMAQRNQIPSRKSPGGGRLLFPKKGLERWANQQEDTERDELDHHQIA